MRGIILFIMAVLAAYRSYAQGTEPSKDTVKIQFGGEFLTLPMPKEGNKVTVNFEDSTGITQISIGKTNKNYKPFGNINQELKPALVEPHRRRISWFNNLEFGFLALMGQANYSSTDTIYESSFTSTLNGTSYNRATQVQVSPERIFPGIAMGFSIREKSRYLGNSNILYTSGTRFRYSRFAASGSYEKKEIKAEIINGSMVYYNDSVYSKVNGQYRSATNIYQLLLPFDFSFKPKKDKELTVGLGANLSLNIVSSKVQTNNGENLKGGLLPSQYIRGSIIQIYPEINFGYKKWKLHLSTAGNRSIIGFGSAQLKSYRMTYFTMSYRLY